MNAAIGWGLAVLAVAVGYWQWGWQGVVLGVTLVVFVAGVRALGPRVLRWPTAGLR